MGELSFVRESYCGVTLAMRSNKAAIVAFRCGREKHAFGHTADGPRQCMLASPGHNWNATMRA